MRHIGIITRLVRQRGFGFIRDAETGEEYFFHRSALPGTVPFESLREGSDGTKVTFKLGESPKGLRAEYVDVV